MDPVDSDVVDPAPPATSLRRLDATQLVRAAEDLLAVDLDGAVSFPEEPSTYGLFQQGVHDIPPALVQSQADLAHEAATRWVLAQQGPLVAEGRFVDGQHPADCAWQEDGGDPDPYVLMWGELQQIYRAIEVPTDGTYWLHLDVVHRGAASGHGGMTAHLELDGETQVGVPVPGDLTATAIAWSLDLTEGRHSLFYTVEQTGERPIDEVQEPCVTEEAVGFARWSLRGPRPPATSEVAVSCDVNDAPCVRDTIQDFAERAWRRPTTPETLDALVAAYDQALVGKNDPLQALGVVIEAILTSPRFLLHIEPLEGTGTAPLDAWALASRLSFALWGTLPDDTLRACAASGDLTEPGHATCGVRAQAERMLSDPRSHVFLARYASRWLGLATLESHPNLAPELAASMQDETIALVDTLIREDRPIEEALTTETSFRDAVLAEHYDEPAPDGSGLTPRPTADADRRGLLGHGAVLTTSSKPLRTAPSARGAWVLERLLCDHPGLPDVDFSAVDDRAALEAHASNPSCRSCHDKIDPVGLTLETFDELGRRRTVPTEPVTMTDGTKVAAVHELAAWIAEDERLAPCAARTLATELLGWPVPEEDVRPRAWLSGTDEAWNGLLLNILTSRSFRERTPKTETP